MKAYLINNVEEYGKFLSILINKDITVWRLYWDERERGKRCFHIVWSENRCYYSNVNYYLREGYEIVRPIFTLNNYGNYELEN